MKPRNKHQKHVVGLSENLKPVEASRKIWAQDNCFDNYFVHSRKSNYCLECGHKWRAEKPVVSVGCSCPECSKELTNFGDWNRDATINMYWAVLDTLDDFQVVRMFRSQKYLKKKQPAKHFHHEVIQHWISPDGTLTSLTARVQGMGMYYDSWITPSKLEVRTNSYKHRLRCNLEPYLVHPDQTILPVLNRNGFCGDFHGHAPHKLFSAILNFPKAETLFKANQFSLFSRFLSHPSQIRTYWPSICIAMRNNYIVADAGDWLDYLGMADELGKDLHSPHYVCPDDLDQAHRAYNKKITEIHKQEKLEEKRKLIASENPKYIERVSRYFDLCFSKDNLIIAPMKSVHQFFSEGEELNHCIFIRDYYKKKHSLILSAKIDGHVVEHVEVDLKRFRVVQARGLDNKPTKYHNRIVSLVEQHMEHIVSASDQGQTVHSKVA